METMFVSIFGTEPQNILCSEVKTQMHDIFEKNESLAAYNWQKWKVHSSHVTVMKFKGKKRLV